MRKSTVTFVIIIAVVALSLSACTSPDNSSQSDSAMTQPTGAMMKQDDSAMENEKMMDDKMTGSRYVQYSKSALDSASSGRRVLFFYASWCPTCKPADASFTQNASKLPEDITVIRVNYNDSDTDQEEKDLAKKYGVTYQHTFVQIDGTGKELTKWNGGQIDELLSNIK